tara:strand:- start:1116 stop:2048 length:933 start_codon:yes stop_codon:yes gene_type:complete
MSKVKINEIESLSSNTDLTITPNGTGTFEVSNSDTDGALQLNSIGNDSKVKIKAPSSSVSQNYTLALPDNQVAQNKYLSVKSITGSGSTAVGQLEYATVTEPNVNLDASQVTTGTLDIARLASPLPASLGLGLKLIQTQEVTQADINATSGLQAIEFTGLEDNSSYMIRSNNLNHISGSYPYNENLQVRFLDSGGTQIGSSSNSYHYYRFGNNNAAADYGSGYSLIELTGGGASVSAHDKKWFEMDITTKQAGESMMATIMDGYTTNTRWGEHWSTLNSAARIHGIRFYGQYGSRFGLGTKISLYKYVES